MEIFKEYLLYNWALVLVLIAFIIMLIITVFLDKKTVIRMFVLIGSVFILSLVVFFEFYLGDIHKYPNIRIVLTAIRYSFTPIIIAFILLTLVKKSRWYVLIPAFVLAIINIISIFTGIVFSVNEDSSLNKGVLGYLPYIGVGIYAVFLVYILVKQSNKTPTDIIPIVFMVFAFSTGLFFPFVIGREYSKIFATTIAIALFVYYVFLILQLTKKDSLTGLLNRQAYYKAIQDRSKDITAIVSIDMNGLKRINDTLGHAEGDLAITTLASCFQRAARLKQSVYRIGGDEFIIVCYRTSEGELLELLSKIRDNVSKTNYSCSIGYALKENQDNDIDRIIKISDKMMYQDKAKYYESQGIERRTK